MTQFILYSPVSHRRSVILNATYDKTAIVNKQCQACSSFLSLKMIVTTNLLINH